MNLITRIQDKIREVKREGKEPDIIWVGRSERDELEKIAKKEATKDCQVDAGKRYEVFGVEVKFVYVESWLSIGCKV